MSTSINVKRKRRGRPATGADPLIGIRLAAEITATIDELAKTLDTSRSNVIRGLIAQALAALDARLEELREGAMRARKRKDREASFDFAIAANSAWSEREAFAARSKQILDSLARPSGNSAKPKIGKGTRE